jgi:hypothetical protein
VGDRKIFGCVLCVLVTSAGKGEQLSDTHGEDIVRER